jgi:hypothetical protein
MPFLSSPIQTENIIFDGHAAVARINLGGAPSTHVLDTMQRVNVR